MRRIRIVTLLTLVLAGSNDCLGDRLKHQPDSAGSRPAVVGRVHNVDPPFQPGELFWPDASYIAPHFEELVLVDERDSLLLISADESKTYQGPRVGGRFWGTPLSGHHVKIQLVNGSGCASYTIRRYAAGLPDIALPNRFTTVGQAGTLVPCGQEDSRPSKCYEATHPSEYRASRAVARLLINGTTSCTGWLIGDQGHMLTNEHCITNESDARNVIIEFGAEGASCFDECRKKGACPGPLRVEGARLVRKPDKIKDYALLQIKADTSEYGFLRARRAGPKVGEDIYIPEHTGGWGKRIALFSTHSQDSADGAPTRPRIHSVEERSCNGPGATDIGHYADGDLGASGAPIISATDHAVVALHRCGGCMNTGVPIDAILADIADTLPPSAFFP
jgi:lysyl endopeptidase